MDRTRLGNNVEMGSKLVIANWKMNPASVKEAIALARASDEKGVVVCPPFPFLSAVAEVVKYAAVGAQDVFWEDKGAYTGEVSPPELAGLGLKYVIVGHSERRQSLGETDAMVAKKIVAAVRSHLVPILCVGETKDEHERGKTKEVVVRQLEIGTSLLLGAPPPVPIIVAYEPIWAISTNPGATPDTPQNAVAMARLIRTTLRTIAKRGIPLEATIVYGGSVTAKNAAAFMNAKEIGGVLVGGASLKKDEFMKIISAASQTGR